MGKFKGYNFDNSYTFSFHGGFTACLNSDASNARKNLNSTSQPQPDAVLNV